MLGTPQNNHAPFPGVHWELEEPEMRWKQLQNALGRREPGKVQGPWGLLEDLEIPWLCFKTFPARG